MNKDIRVEAIYPQSPEIVWKALTDSRAIAAWLMPNDFQPVVGHKFNFKTKPAPGFDGVVNCEVLEIDEPRCLSYKWEGGGIETTVTFTLEQVSEGTRLVLDHTGFSGVRGLFVSKILEDGWRKKIIPGSLKSVVAQIGDGSFEASSDTVAACH
jgi:uncharacterized protein YndB with AHSA1/START domain